MIEPFQKNGQWWLPDQDNKVPGILTFDPMSGITVSLFQPLSVEFARLEVRQSQIIHGIVDGSIKISLLDCLEVIGKTRLAREIHSSSKIVARQCVIGTHLCSSSRFNNFRLAIHNYAQFMCRTGIHPATGHDAGFMWDRVEPIEFEVKCLTLTWIRSGCSLSQRTRYVGATAGKRDSEVIPWHLHE